MLCSIPLVFLSMSGLIIGALLVLMIVGVALFRRPDMPGRSQVLVLLGLLLLGLAAGEVAYLQKDPHEIVVMVDLSPSTRGAQYRDVKFLKQRIGTLLRDRSYRIVYFSDENRTGIPVADRLSDLPAAKTAFNPPPAAAIVLFSD